MNSERKKFCSYTNSFLPGHELVFAGSYLYRVMQIANFFFILMISPKRNFHYCVSHHFPDVFPCFVNEGAVVMSYMSMHKL